MAAGTFGTALPITALQSTIAASGTANAIQISEGRVKTVGIQISGTWVGTIEFDASIDGTNWTAVSLTPFPSGTAASRATANGTWTGNIEGMIFFRANPTAWTSGTATVTINMSPN